jgi:hypothetical protein
MPDNSTADDPAKTPEAAPEAASSEPRVTSWVLPVATAVVLIAAFCLYYFVYVKAQREYLGNRNFRTLAALGDQLQTQVSIHGSILEFYADLARKIRHDRETSRTPVDFEKQILVVRPEDKGRPHEAREAKKDYMRFLSPTFELANSPTNDPPTNGPQKPSEAPSRLSTLHRNGHWVLQFDALGGAANNTDFRGSLVLEDLFHPLVGSLPFDDILLASDTGEIVYQSKRDGPRFTTLAALLDNQTGDAAKKPSGTPAGTPPKTDPAPKTEAAPKADSVSIHLTEVALTGTTYKLFLQPVWIDAFNDDPNGKDERHRWMLCGLRSAATLEWEALAISYTVIIWLTVLLFAVCTGGPILKLFLMNHRERLHLRELGFLGLFLVLMSGVFTLSGLQAAHFHSNDDDTVGKLQKLGEYLSNDIHLELGLMRDQLVSMCHTKALIHDLKEAEQHEVTRQRIADFGHNDNERPESTQSTFDKDYSADLASEVQKHPNPNFNNAFWTDDDGQQVIKWNPGDYVTPFIDVSKLGAFTEHKTSYLDADAASMGPLHFDSLLPPNRLEYLVAVSMKTEDCVPEMDKAGIKKDISGGQAFLTAQPFSLIDPVLPFGYGFALVDQTGVVLFHSDKTKNLRENFLQENEWNRELSAAVVGHSTQSSLKIRYLGKDYRARVVPIAGLSQVPWSLIVYRDLTSVRTLDLQSMTMSSTLFLLFLMGPFACVAVWWFIRRPPFAPECVWPNPVRMAAYGYLIALYALLIVVFLFLGFGVSAEEAVIACAAVPYTALLMTFWCFRLYPAPGEDRAKRGRPLLLPATFSGVAAVVFLAMLVLQWSYSKHLTILLGVAAIAAVPLLRRPRLYVVRTFRRWSKAGGPLTGPRHWASGPFAYRTGYTLSFLLLLLLVGVLTPMALFRASLSVERRLQVKQAQLRLASALERQQRSIDDHHEEYWDRADLWYDEFFRDTPKHTDLKFIPLFRLDGNPSIQDHSGTGGREFYSNWFRGLIYTLHHDYNEAATETLSVISDRPGFNPVPDWTWRDEGASIKLLWHGTHPPAGEEEKTKERDLVIESELPGFSAGETWNAVGIGAGVMLVIGAIFWTLAQKLFLFHIDPLKLDGQRNLAESLRDGRNVMILLPPVSDWQWEEPTWKMDVLDLAIAPKWAELVDLDTVPRQMLIEIRRFEHTTGDPEIDNQKFLFLERLIHKADIQFAAVMTVNPSPEDYRRQFPNLDVVDLREEPFQWRAAYAGPARDLIWRECGPLPALWPIGAQLAKDIAREAVFSEDTIASEILERADAYYRMIWHECPKEQKFVLAQLAVDGLLNPTNERAVRQLVRRGLITKDPQFRIMNESFRRFLRTAATPQLMQEWLHESRQSGWGKAHGVVFTTVALVGVFLLATQNGLLESSTGYVTTALTAFATLAKGFNTIRGRGSSDKPS